LTLLGRVAGAPVSDERINTIGDDPSDLSSKLFWVSISFKRLRLSAMLSG